METNNNITALLNELLELNMKYELKYKECINQIFHRGVRAFFVTQSQLKNKYVHQLSLEIQQQGGDFTAVANIEHENFPFYDNLHRLTFESVLDVCLDLEKEIIAKYEKVLSNNLPETTENLILKQKTELELHVTAEKVAFYKTHERLVS